jgi:hypothetical protein
MNIKEHTICEKYPHNKFDCIIISQIFKTIWININTKKCCDMLKTCAKLS